MKSRRHHNNEGRKQVATGRTVEQVKRMGQRLGIPVRVGAVLHDYSQGRTESRQPGGLCYVVESSDAFTPFGLLGPATPTQEGNTND